MDSQSNYLSQDDMLTKVGVLTKLDGVAEQVVFRLMADRRIPFAEVDSSYLGTGRHEYLS